MTNVVSHITSGERIEFIVNQNALAKLTEFRKGENILQFWLPQFVQNGSQHLLFIDPWIQDKGRIPLRTIEFIE